jgi:hypothetical protein
VRLLLAIALFTFSVLLLGQIADQGGRSGSVSLTGGSIPQSINLRLSTPPAPGDSIIVNVPTQQVRIALITPLGQRITRTNATAAGFDWLSYPHKLPLGSQDAGAAAEITFRNKAPAGRYRIELTSPTLRAPLTADARFTSRMETYTRLIRKAAGAQISDPVRLDGGAVVRLNLAPPEMEALMDIVVPDSTVSVTLTLPNGRKLGSTQPQMRPGEWEKIEVLHGEDKTTRSSILLGTGVLIPVDGTHYVVGLEKPEPGLYEVRATGGRGGSGELRVAFVPTGNFFRAAQQALEEAGDRPATATVKVRPKPLPFEGFAGDRLELVLDLVGDAVTQPPRFEVRLERRAKLRDTDTGIQYANPDPVESRPAEFTRTADGTYHGWVTLPGPGMVRIGVRAQGTSAAGAAFTDEAIATNEYMIVKPVVAHFRSLSERAAGVTGASQYDSLEVTAELDVIEPGEYRLSFGIRDAAGTSFPGGGFSGAAKLLPGVRRLTVSVPARKLRSELRDGPFEIYSTRIWRTEPSASVSSWVEVPTGDASLRTAAYARNQWNPGAFFGEDRVSVRGVRRAASGRFLYAEVEWNVNTPGGACNWNGTLGGNVITPAGTLPLQYERAAELPAGRTTLTFFFDGSGIAALPNRNPEFAAIVYCASDATKEGVRPPPQRLELNPSEYEPAHTRFFVHAQNPLWLYAGSSGTTSLLVPGKPAPQVRFTLKQVPPQFESELVHQTTRPEVTAWVSLQVRAKTGTAPGRYYIAVDVTCGGETETTEVVVDVIAGSDPAKAPNPR